MSVENLINAYIWLSPFLVLLGITVLARCTESTLYSVAKSRYVPLTLLIGGMA